MQAKLPETLVASARHRRSSSCAVNEEWLRNLRGLANYTCRRSTCRSARLCARRPTRRRDAGRAWRPTARRCHANYNMTNAQVHGGARTSARRRRGEHRPWTSRCPGKSTPRINSRGHALRQDPALRENPDQRRASTSTTCFNANTGTAFNQGFGTRRRDLPAQADHPQPAVRPVQRDDGLLKGVGR